MGANYVVFVRADFVADGGKCRGRQRAG